MNMAYKYPIIYWNCANLIVDSASDEDIEGTTDYGKVGVSICNMQNSGINIDLPLINKAGFGFTPDEENNKIIFGFKAMNGIGDELAQKIIENRPYTSMEDFGNRMLKESFMVNENGETEKVPSIIKKSQMIQLIKAGCFTELHSPNRKETMDWYLRNYVFSETNSLTLNQLGKIKELNIIPEEISLAEKMINFKKYVLRDEALFDKYIDPTKKMIKRGYHDGRYLLDDVAMEFFKLHFTEDSVIDVRKGNYIVSEKKFIKEVDSYIQPLKDWFSKPETLRLYNDKLYESLWSQYASGSESKWNMESLTYYEYGKHELENINEDEYGIVNFFNLPEEPVPYDWYTKYINGEPKKLPKYTISCIAGTVVNADNAHHTVTLITKYGAVNVKVNKGKYSYYNMRISKLNEETNKKQVLEESWFKRGTLLRICGIKRDDMFFPYKYSDTIYSHTINLITGVNEDGTIDLQYARYGAKGEDNE